MTSSASQRPKQFRQATNPTWIYLFGPRSTRTIEAGRECAKHVKLNEYSVVDVDDYVAKDPKYIAELKKSAHLSLSNMKDAFVSHVTSNALIMSESLTGKNNGNVIYVRHEPTPPYVLVVNIDKIACFALSDTAKAHDEWASVVQERMQRFAEQPGVCGDPPPVLGAGAISDTALLNTLSRMYDECLFHSRMSSANVCGGVFVRILVYDCNIEPKLVFDSKNGIYGAHQRDLMVTLATRALGIETSAAPKAVATPTQVKCPSDETGWFCDTFGFIEETGTEGYKTTKAMFKFSNNTLTSLANNNRWTVTPLQTPTLRELRTATGLRRATIEVHYKEPTKFNHIISDVATLQKANANAVFQLASQFNALEMRTKYLTPEDGLTIYAKDHTQGPAAAISCAPALVYRQFFLSVSGVTGQTKERQYNALGDVEARLNNKTEKFFTIKNGYTTAAANLDRLAAKIKDLPDLMDMLQIPYHESAQVLGTNHTVCQVLTSVAETCSARNEWEAFARAVLCAAYEGVLLVALKLKRTDVFLTLIGGDSFCNKLEWIYDAMNGALDKYKSCGLNVRLVHYDKDHYDSYMTRTAKLHKSNKASVLP